MRGMRVAAVGCFVVALGGSGWIGWDATRSEPSRNDRAVAACKAKARSSATAEGKLEFKDLTVTAPAGDTFVRVVGDVVGPNGFGARVKVQFACTAGEMMDGSFTAQLG